MRAHCRCHDGANSVVLVKSCKRCEHLARHLNIERVQVLRAIERDQTDALPSIDLDGFVRTGFRRGPGSIDIRVDHLHAGLFGGSATHG